jgi:hypothetical protein
MLSKEDNEFFLRISSKTWGRDSHGLFDYESIQIKTNTLCIDTCCKVVRKRNDVKNFPENLEIDIEDRELCKVISEGSKY